MRSTSGKGTTKVGLPDHVGRIRLNESEARLLARLLWDYREEMLDLRSAAVEGHEDTGPYNAELGRIRKIWDEIALLADQKGWDVG